MTILIKKKLMAVCLAIVLLNAVNMTVQPAKVYATPGVSSPVGIVDYDLLLKQHPDTQKASDSYKAEVEQAKNEFAAKSADLNEQQKQDLNAQLMQRVEQKRYDMLKPITDKINAAIKEVADTKGLSLVIAKNLAIYGGMDITDDVLKKITGK